MKTQCLPLVVVQLLNLNPLQLYCCIMSLGTTMPVAMPALNALPAFSAGVSLTYLDLQLQKTAVQTLW